jgi:hypothetical protein
MFEAREFCIYTDHKPVTFAYNLKSNQLISPRQYRHLDYTSQFTTDLRHIADADNVVTDALSRVEEVELPMDYQALAVAQELREVRQSASSLQLKEMLIPGTTNPSPATCRHQQLDRSSRDTFVGQHSTQSTACPTRVSRPP